MAQVATKLLKVWLARSWWEVEVGQTLRIGRHEANDVVLEDRRVSRFHAKVVWEGDRPVLTDGGSLNNTFVDGRPLRGHMRLRDGQALSVGPYSLRVELEESRAPALLSDDDDDLVWFTEQGSADWDGVFVGAGELHSTLLALEEEERTGTLHLHLGPVTAELTLCLGRVVQARHGRLHDLEALQQVLAASVGSFRFSGIFQVTEGKLDLSVRRCLSFGQRSTRRHDRRRAA